MYTDTAAITIGIFAIIFSVGAGLVTAAAVVNSSLASLERRIAYLDRKINRMMDQMGVHGNGEMTLEAAPDAPPATLTLAQKSDDGIEIS